MASIRDSAVTINALATTSMVCNMPTHVSGDLLVAFVAKDTNTAFTTPANWNAIRTVISAGAAGGVYTKWATSDSETVTFALTSEECCALVISVTGAEAEITSAAAQINVVAAGLTYTRLTGSFTTDGFSVGQTVIMSGFTNAGNNGPKEIVSITGAGLILTVTSVATLVNETGGGDELVKSSGLDKSAASGADDTSLPLAGIGVTPIANNCLILHGLIADIGAGISTYSPWVNLSPMDTGTASLSVSYSFLPTAAAITAPNHWATIITGVDERSVIITVRDSGSDKRPAYIPLSTTPSTLITPLAGLDAVDAGAWVAAASIVITTVNGKTVTGVTIANTLDAGYNPFRAAATTAGISSTTLLGHSEFNLTTPVNLTTLKGLLFGTYKCTIPRDYLDLGSALQGGIYILSGSTTGNYKTWVVGGQFDKETDSASRQNYLIEVANSDTIYSSVGSADYTSADYWAFGSSGYYGAASIAWNELYSINEIILAGGSSAVPITFEEVISTINQGSGNIPLLQKAGAVATCWCPIRFGGTEAIDISLNLNTFQYPIRADESKYTHFHCSNDKVGFEFYGVGSGDTLTFTNCLFTSPSSYYWRFNASHSASTVMNFSGTSVVKANVTLRSTIVLDSMTFINCTAFALNSAAVTNSNFSNTKVATSVITELEDIDGCSFTSSGTGYAIEVTGTAGNVTLTNVSFSGYAVSNGSTGNEAIFINIASGTCNITVSGGTTPSIRTAGATVNVILNPVTFTVTVKNLDTSAAIENARVIVPVTSSANFPYQAPVTITGAGTTATVTHTSHGRSTNDNILISGANQDEYNGVFTITYTGVNTYTYTTPDTVTASPATGTIIATMALINGLTNASGIITDTRSYVSNQTVSGWARKATGSPLYRQAPVADTVNSSTGLSVTVFLQPDE